MARAIANCTCATCGNTFIRMSFARNRTEADKWVDWAEKYFDECTDCYYKRLRDTEAAKPFTIEVTLNSFSPAVWLIASGDTMPHKDELKAKGFRWANKPEYNPSDPLRCWQLKIPFSDDISDVLAEITEYLEKIGARIDVKMSETDMDEAYETYLVHKKIRAEKAQKEQEKEEAKAAIERPVRPSWLPEGRWNGKIYGGKRYGYSVFIWNRQIYITAEQVEELKKWSDEVSAYETKIKEIESR